jgi:hypothetical protein
MLKHLKRSRVTKALTDAGLAASFGEAEALLDKVHVCVSVGEDQACTAAGQAAALTALTTAYKCFGRVSLSVQTTETVLIAPLALDRTLEEAARTIGADVGPKIPDGVTHVVEVGQRQLWAGWRVQCWWDRWLAGTRVGGPSKVGDSRLALSGVFAGALAIRQVFASVRTGASGRAREATVSLWEPWREADLADCGPARFTAPGDLWLVGLGHLGQAFVWNLLLLPYREPRRAILQDDQRIDEENEATSLLVTATDIGRRKVRLASSWMEAGGWETSLIERRHQGDPPPFPDDPPFLLSGLDALPPRRRLALAGFDYMIDAGIGHGPGDFEGIQVRVIAKGAALDELWDDPAENASRNRLLSGEAYQALEQEIGACGTFTLANASVAVPFVGAATGAIAIAQLIRVASMQAGGALIQLELAAPEMVIDGGRSASPQAFLGGEIIDLDDIEVRACAA